MPDQIVYLDVYKLKEGTAEAFERYAADMSELAQANNPGVVSFNYYLGDDRRSGVFVAVFSDADALDRHLELAGQKFQEGAALLESADRWLLGGTASDQAVEMLNAFEGTVAAPLTGFSR